jgi:hypothetical protein
LDSWAKNETTRGSFYPGINLYSSIYNIDRDVQKYLQKILWRACLNYGINPQLSDMFVDLHSMNSNFIKYISGHFKTVGKKNVCSLEIEFSYGLDDPATGKCVTEDIFYENAKGAFGEHDSAMFFDKILTSLCDVDEMFLGDYEIEFGQGAIYINGIDLHDEELLQKMVYKKLANEYPTYHYKEESIEVSYDISLLPLDFDEDVYSQRLQETIANNDYEAASKFSELLEIHQLLTALSLHVCNILKDIVNETKVVTITIQKPLLNLFDLKRGEKSAKNFIGDEVDRHWNNLKIRNG